MSQEAPYELPAPMAVADMCALQAWMDDVPDDSRILHEMSADTIRSLMKRCMRLAQVIERMEATRVH
jgi:hypothetical protein